MSTQKDPSGKSEYSEEIFLSSDEIIENNLTKNSFVPQPEMSDDGNFLTPDEMIAMSSGKKSRACNDDHTDEIFASKELDAEEVTSASDSFPDDEDSAFLTPDEMLAMSISKKGSQPEERAPRKSDLLSKLDNLITEVKEVEISDKSKREMLDTLDEEETKVPIERMRSAQFSPSEIAGETITEKELNQLDVGPFLKKKDIDSPDEFLVRPDDLEEEEEFESRALPTGTVIFDQYKVIKIFSEKKNRNTYLVKDIKETAKKFILKEYIAPEVSKEELRPRKDKFRDTIRIINTFKHKNLAEVYEGFSENGREYCLMQNVDGLDLTKLADMSTAGFCDKDVVKWGAELCDAMEFMHYRPTPFTVNELEPRHIVVDESGSPKIINYDLHRFFDLKRTLEFMPDDPTTLYGDITELSRVLYFLLTKKYYDEDAFEIEWPENTSKKMRKLLETACCYGQKTFGDIKDFKAKLLDTLIEDEPFEVRKRNWGFPLHKIDFSFIRRGIDRVLALNPVVLIITGLAIIFVLTYYSVTLMKTAAVSKYNKPENAQIAYIYTVDELALFNAKNYLPIFKKENNKKITVMYPAIVSIKKPASDQAEQKHVMLTGYNGEGSLDLIDTQNLEVIGEIKGVNSPIKIIPGETDRILYVLNSGNETVTVIDLDQLKAINVIPTGLEPVDIAYIPLSKKDIEVRQQKLDENKNGQPKPVNKPDYSVPIKERRRFKPQIPSSTLVISEKGSHDLLFIDANAGTSKGSLSIQGTPGSLAVSPDNSKIYLADVDNKKLLLIDPSKTVIKKEIALTGNNPSSLAIDKEQGRLWITLKNSDMLDVVDIKADKVVLSNALTKYPAKIIYNSVDGNLWVLNEGSKDIAVIDPKTGEALKHIGTGKNPTAIGIEY